MITAKIVHPPKFHQFKLITQITIHYWLFPGSWRGGYDILWAYTLVVHVFANFLTPVVWCHLMFLRKHSTWQNHAWPSPRYEKGERCDGHCVERWAAQMWRDTGKDRSKQDKTKTSASSPIQGWCVVEGRLARCEYGKSTGNRFFSLDKLSYSNNNHMCCVHRTY